MNRPPKVSLYFDVAEIDDRGGGWYLVTSQPGPKYSLAALQGSDIDIEIGQVTGDSDLCFPNAHIYRIGEDENGVSVLFKTP